MRVWIKVDRDKQGNMAILAQFTQKFTKYTRTI